MDFNKICNDILNLTKEENKEEFLKTILLIKIFLMILKKK